MKALGLALKKQPIVYVTLDIERALGLPLTTKNYSIVTNSDPFSRELAKKHKNILLIKNQKQLSTRELLEHSKVIRFISGITNPHILTFHNALSTQEICQKNGWTLLNPSAQLANSIEEKISQVQWLGPLAKFLPKYEIKLCKEITWKQKKFILQFNKAHTGSGTLLIESEEQLKKIQRQFPERPVRLLQFIEGPTFTNNNIVWGKKVLIGSVNYQITGLKPFTNRPFATIGNDWALPSKLLSTKQLHEYSLIAKAVGQKLQQEGWKGLFGIDVVMDQKTNKLYLIEVNARQPASTTYESWLQQITKHTNTSITTFEAHLASLLNLDVTTYRLIPLIKGAQIIKRVIENQPDISLAQKRILQKKLAQQGFTTILYQNKNIGGESLRIQSKSSIMKTHNELAPDVQKKLTLLD